MKKLLTISLAVAMALAMSATTLAAVDIKFDGNNKPIKLTSAEIKALVSGTEFLSKGGYLATYEDFLTISPPSDVMVPGQTYYFPCTWSGRALSDEFFEVYSTAITINSTYDSSEKADSDYVSSATAKGRVKDAAFVKATDGNYYFKFTANTGFSYTKEIDVRIVVVSKDKNDSDYRDWEEFDLTIGYSDMGKSNPQYVTSSNYTVDNTTPIIEFGEEVTSCKVEFEGGSYYNAIFSTKKARTVNLLHTEVANDAIKGSNPTANLSFLAFPAMPTFSAESTFKFYAPGKSYLYSIDTDNKLTQLANQNNSDFMGFATSKLGAYVASDVPLKSASTITPPTTTPPTTSTGGSVSVPPSQPTGGGNVPFNPGTGAAV